MNILPYKPSNNIQIVYPIVKLHGGGTIRLIEGIYATIEAF